MDRPLKKRIEQATFPAFRPIQVFGQPCRGIALNCLELLLSEVGRPAEVRPVEVRFAEVCFDEVRLAGVRLHTEISSG